MSGIYPIDDVRRALEKCGGRPLEAKSPELPAIFKGATGENWLVPTPWKRTPFVVVHLGVAYPDDPPSLYLPSREESWPLIPHVNRLGSICTIGDDATVHPEKPLEVLEGMLLQAGDLLDKEYSEEAKLAEVISELTAYWSLGWEGTAYYFATDVAEGVLKVQKDAGRNETWQLAPIVGKAELARSDGLGIVLDVSREDLLKLVDDPVRLILSSKAIEKQMLVAGEYIANHNRAAKRLPIFLIFRLPADLKAGVLVGCLRGEIRIKRASGEIVARNILDGLKKSGLRRLSVEDLSSRRLLFRTAGPDFSESLLEKKVALIGCGSLGGFLADALARSGVRRMLFLDKDHLEAANLGRHVGGRRSLGRPKAVILSELLQDRLPDAEAIPLMQDFRADDALEQLRAFGPDITIFATGDTNSDLTGARIAAEGGLGTCCFVWAESDLIGGHLVCQPAGSRPLMIQLHSDNGHYRFRIKRDPSEGMLKEAGCQTAYSPYSGANMMQFCYHVSREVLSWLSGPPPLENTLRWNRENPSRWERMDVEGWLRGVR